MEKFIYPELKLDNNSKIIQYYNNIAYKYVDLDELLSENIINHYGISGLNFIDEKILRTIVDIREYFKLPIHINNWKYFRDKNIKANSSQIMNERIVRFPDSEVYSVNSRHSVWIKDNIITKQSDACDFTIKDMESEKVRNEIRKNKDKEPFKNINAIEKNVGWIHIDLRSVKNRIFEF